MEQPGNRDQSQRLYEILWSLREGICAARDSKTITLQNDVDRLDRLAGMADTAIGILIGTIGGESRGRDNESCCKKSCMSITSSDANFWCRLVDWLNVQAVTDGSTVVQVHD